MCSGDVFSMLSVMQYLELSQHRKKYIFSPLFLIGYWWRGFYYDFISLLILTHIKAVKIGSYLLLKPWKAKLPWYPRGLFFFDVQSVINQHGTTLVNSLLHRTLVVVQLPVTLSDYLQPREWSILFLHGFFPDSSTSFLLPTLWVFANILFRACDLIWFSYLFSSFSYHVWPASHASVFCKNATTFCSHLSNQSLYGTPALFRMWLSRSASTSCMPTTLSWSPVQCCANCETPICMLSEFPASRKFSIFMKRLLAGVTEPGSSAITMACIASDV